MKNILETPRLIVRRFVAGDLADFLDYQSRPEVVLYSGGHTLSEQEAAAFLADQANAGDGRNGIYHAFAVHHSADGKVIGDIGLYLHDGPEETADLGFQFHPDYHGKGYATEAAAAFVNHAFTHWNLRRITAGCASRNVASVRLIERLGMRREAHFIQSRTLNGELHDEYHHALLRDEWKARQP